MMIKLPRKIVLCGVSRSGKSTLGNNFHRRFGHLVTAFADPLKHAAQAIFGFDKDHLWGPSHTRETPYPAFEFSGFCFQCQTQCAGPERHTHLVDDDDFIDWTTLEKNHGDDPDYYRCDTCGAQFGRYVTPREALKTLGTDWGRNFCPELWANACFLRMKEDASYVITDGRFRNEHQAAARYRACTVLLKRGLKESNSPHPSEAEIRQMANEPGLFDLVLDNREGTAEENFQKLVDGLDTLYRTTSELGPIEWHAYEDRSRGLT